MKTNGRLESTKNVSGVKNARIGRYKGKQYVFTHRNPHTGEVWSDDIPDRQGEPGKWVPSDQVEFAN